MFVYIQMQVRGESAKLDDVELFFCKSFYSSATIGPLPIG